MQIKKLLEKLGSILLPLLLKGRELLMSLKPDRSAARTAADIERKYSFGKKFSEILGLIDDTRDKVDSVESGLRDEISETATTLKRDTESLVFQVEETIKRDGITQVTTTTGYRFDKDGLDITKSGEAMTNLLNHTGMYVKRWGENVLVANDEGVEAVNLHAKTYLIIGADNGRSRIEDYRTNRTGVFWIG
jgi:hypothetical protein